MKLELSDEEMIYLYNMVMSSVQQLTTLLNTQKMLTALAQKIEPPRRYCNLSAEDRTNLFGISQTGLTAISSLLAKAETDKKQHLEKAQTVLISIQSKLKEGEVSNETAQV